ncbi:ArsR family transcriptional regulator [Candidatus Micrarchaeota archaeon]|nr:ArsR family transcriptional regulator [Candidatus Micrarchaeota archaeon]
MDEITIGKEEFKALSSDTRIEIIKLLNERNYTLSEISAKLNMSSPTIKQHLETLVHSDLIEQKDEGRKWKYYCLTRKGKKIVEPEGEAKVMILLGATIIGVIAVAYIIMSSGMFASGPAISYQPANTNKEFTTQDALNTGEESIPIKKEETIKEILLKAEEPKNMEFELVEKPDSNTTAPPVKYYLKDEKFRTETQAGETKIVEIFDGENLYANSSAFPETYNIESVGGGTGKGMTSLEFNSIALKALNAKDLTEKGKEIIQGMQTRIIEFTYNNGTQEKIKAWVSEEYGIPVKYEIEKKVNEETLNQYVELKNIKVNVVLDSDFAVSEEQKAPTNG